MLIILLSLLSFWPRSEHLSIRTGIPPATAEPAALPARGPVPKSKRVHPMRRNKSLMKNFLWLSEKACAERVLRALDQDVSLELDANLLLIEQLIPATQG